jgi:glutathione synthase/RimK-type ligase-like ATP-grasp enzyme
VEGSHFFVNWSVPLVSDGVARLCRDKDFLAKALEGIVRMPRTLALLDWNIKPEWEHYVGFRGDLHQLERMLEDFSYPVIVKRNSGSQGSNVFLCRNLDEVADAIRTIFNRSSSEYDYVALVQEYFPVLIERRVVLLDGKVMFTYRKDITEARFCGNLSPLHWEDAKGVLEGRDVEWRMEEFLRNVFIKFPLIRYAGADVLEDHQGNLCLVELNTSPSYRVYIRDNGDAQVVRLYREILQTL